MDSPLTQPSPIQGAAAYVVLGSASLARLVAFYGELLGQAANPHWPDRYAEFQLGGLRLGLFQPQPDSIPEFQASTSGGMSLCLEVADIEAAIAHLTQLGYPPPGPLRTASHGREIYAYDPDGNRLILHQGRP